MEGHSQSGPTSFYIVSHHRSCSQRPEGVSNWHPGSCEIGLSRSESSASLRSGRYMPTKALFESGFATAAVLTPTSPATLTCAKDDRQQLATLEPRRAALFFFWTDLYDLDLLHSIPWQPQFPQRPRRSPGLACEKPLRRRICDFIANTDWQYSKNAGGPVHISSAEAPVGAQGPSVWMISTTLRSCSRSAWCTSSSSQTLIGREGFMRLRMVVGGAAMGSAALECTASMGVYTSSSTDSWVLFGIASVPDRHIELMLMRW